MTGHRRLVERRPFICVRCFNDKRLIEWIKEKEQRGRCSWCGARQTYLVRLTELGEPFRAVADTYVPSEDFHGDSISFLMQEDWEIFSERLLAKLEYSIDELVEGVRTGDLHPKEDAPDYRGLFRRSDRFHSTLEEEWEDRVARALGGASPFDIPASGDESEMDLYLRW